MIAPAQSSGPKKRKKRNFSEGKRNTSGILRIGELNNSLIEQPNTISFEDIEG